MLLNGALTIIWPETDDPWQSRVVLRPVGVEAGELAGGPPVHHPEGIETDVDGHVTRLRTGHTYWTRR